MTEETDTAASRSSLAATLLEQLIAEPQRFSFDAAMDIIRQATEIGETGQTVHFKTPPGLATPASDVLDVTAEPNGTIAVTTAFTGLTGHGGTLPRPYTALADEEHRKRSPALAAFTELLIQRAMSQFAAAGAKYHPHRQGDHAYGAIDQGAFANALFALTGFDSEATRKRLSLSPLQLLYFSGTFASWPRSAERLRALLRKWLNADIRVEQFSGVWRAIDREQQTALPAPGRAPQFAQLGVDATIGQQTWDVNSRINIVIGPLSYTDFEALLPDQDRLQEALSIIQTYLDDEAEASVTLSLRSDEVPASRMGQARLGWTSWLGMSKSRETDVYDVTFDSTALARAGQRL